MKYKVVIIILLTVLIVMLSGVTYSVFTSDVNLGVKDQDIAKFIFESEKLDQINLPITNMQPKDILEFPFSVTNESDGVISNVSVLYKIAIKTFHFMPLNIELYKKNDNTEQLVMVCDESYSRNSENELVCNTDEFLMTHENGFLDNYVLKVSFPENYNTPNYADLIDYIDLEITSSQKMEE